MVNIFNKIADFFIAVCGLIALFFAWCVYWVKGKKWR